MEEQVLATVTLKDILEESAVSICHLCPPKGVVYIVSGCCPYDNPYRGIHKIGHTRSLVDRVPQLQARFGCTMFITHVIWTDEPSYLEARLHDLFSDRRTDALDGTEWFDLSHEDINWLQTFEAIAAFEVRYYINEPDEVAINMHDGSPRHYNRIRQV